jgi:hypothetical protein
MTTPQISQEKLVKRVNGQLGRFMECVRNLAGQQANKELRAEADQIYRDIHFACVRHHINDDDLTIEGIDAEHQQTVRQILALGRNNFESFNVEATSHLRAAPQVVGRDKQAVLVTFAEFIKSPSAHDLVNGGAKQAPDIDEAIVGLFNGLFGIEITQGFARSIRVEQLGRILAYAMSSQCDDDLAMLETDPINIDPERRNRWLMGRIDHANLTFGYRTKISGNGETQVAAMVSDRPFEPGQLREGWVADACVVDEQRKTLIIGGATSGRVSDNQQTEQAVDKRMAAELLVGQEFVGDPARPNKFHGWKIETFQINLGLVAVDRLAATGKGVGEQMISRLFPTRRPDRKDILALAQLGHLAMFAEEEAMYGQVGRVWSLTNVHLIGCDTLPYYSKRMRAVEQGGRAMSLLVLETLQEASSVLARSETMLPLGVHGAGAVRPLLDTLIGAVQNHFANFPAERMKDLLPEEVVAMERLRDDFRSIENKLKSAKGTSGNPYLKKLKKLNELLCDEDDLRDSIRADGKLPDKSMQWSDTLYNRLQDKDDSAPDVERAVRRRSPNA